MRVRLHSRRAKRLRYQHLERLDPTPAGRFFSCRSDFLTASVASTASLTAMLRTTPLAVFFLVACAALPAPEVVIQVEPPTGEQSQDRARIVAAFERAEPGDTIRFAAGTYEVGPIIRVVTPDLTLLGHPDGTTLRGGDGFDAGADFGIEQDAIDALGVLHLFEGGAVVRGLTFTDSFWGLLLGWHFGLEWDERMPENPGGFTVEGNTFRNVRNGIRLTSWGEARTVVRENTFEDARFGVGAIGSGITIEGNRFALLSEASQDDTDSAIAIGGERVAASSSDNLVAGNEILGHRTGVLLYIDGARIGTGNIVRDNRIDLRAEGGLAGVVLIVRGERGADGPPAGGLIGTLIEQNAVTGATWAAISIGAGCNDSRVVGNTFSELQGPAISLDGSGTEVSGHAPDIEIRQAETSVQPAAENP